MISGHGSATPDAILIGDTPTTDDMRSGYALTGYQESILRDMCKQAGLSIQNFYRTCLIKDNLTSQEDEAIAQAVKQYSPILVNEIQELNPFLLIPLGEQSFSHLTSLRSIRKFRGSCMLADGALGLGKPVKVLPILGPYPYLNQEYRLRYISRIDFQKVPKYLNTDLPPEKFTKTWIAWTSSALRAFLERSYTAEGLLVFDIETYMGIPTCISFCFDGIESVCVPFLDPAVDVDNRVLMIDLIARILASPIRKVNQNIKYDWKVLERWGFSVVNVVGDTMLAASCLYCEFPKNLGFLTSIYTDIPYFKDEGREYDPQKHKKEQFYLYNAKDSLATHQIYVKQAVEVVEQGVDWVYNKLVELMPVYRRMEDRGFAIDLDIREELLSKYSGLYEINCKKLSTLVGQQYINPLSSQQMNKLVFTELGFKKIRGVQGTDEESLELLMVFGEASRSPNYGKDVLQTILDCRKIHKVIEILELELHPDGRFRCEFNLAGTETGRTSAGKTTDRIIVVDGHKLKVINLGHSLQTIGKHGFMIDGVTYGRDIRRMFIASPGFSLVEVDLSQAEARVDAVLAGNFDILSVFDGPIGIHRLTGSWIYGCNPLEIKKDVLVDGTERYLTSKVVRHAAERNLKQDTLARLLQKPVTECGRILTAVHKFQPELREVFHRDVITAINAKRELRAPNGRLRQFFDRIDNHTYNEGISTLPQAIVSDQTKFHGILDTAHECPWAHFIAEGHDGGLAEVPHGRELEFIEKYKKNIEVPIDFRTCSLSRDYQLVIPCEASVGQNWYELKGVK